MPCEHYKDALIEAAASDAAPSGELSAHLAECASCRNAYAEEQVLFAAIDSGLRSAANSEVTRSLLPRVRAGLDKAAAPQLRWVQPLVSASASAILALVVFLLARPHRDAPEFVAKQGPAVVPSPVAPATKTSQEGISSERTRLAATRAGHSRAPHDSTNLHSATSGNPEVLVPPDEREAFERFLGAEQGSLPETSSSVEWAPRPPRGSVEILPVEIVSLRVEPLDKNDDEQTGSKIP